MKMTARGVRLPVAPVGLVTQVVVVALNALACGRGNAPSEGSATHNRLAPLSPGAREDLEVRGAQCTPNEEGPVFCTWVDGATRCQLTFDTSDQLTRLDCSVGDALEYTCSTPPGFFVCRWSDEPNCADVYGSDGRSHGYLCGEDLDDHLRGSGAFDAGDLVDASTPDGGDWIDRDAGAAELDATTHVDDASADGRDAGTPESDGGSSGGDTGSVLTDGSTPPGVGCADGQREGFLDVARYPSIAGCSGAWSVPGVTRDNMTATCSRNGGDDSSRSDGFGCAAIDLCAPGWHVCAGAPEVASLARHCDDAVPPAAPNKSLFFAVAQESDSGGLCAHGTGGWGDNDVFGCGNLGTVLGADKGCGPLTRVLASTSPGRCGYNEAEPPLGPWECRGGSDAHFHEGAHSSRSSRAGTIRAHTAAIG